MRVGFGEQIPSEANKNCIGFAVSLYRVYKNIHGNFERNNEFFLTLSNSPGIKLAKSNHRIKTNLQCTLIFSFIDSCTLPQTFILMFLDAILIDCWEFNLQSQICDS